MTVCGVGGFSVVLFVEGLDEGDDGELGEVGLEGTEEGFVVGCGDVAWGVVAVWAGVVVRCVMGRLVVWPLWVVERDAGGVAFVMGVPVRGSSVPEGTAGKKFVTGGIWLGGWLCPRKSLQATNVRETTAKAASAAEVAPMIHPWLCFSVGGFQSSSLTRVGGFGFQSSPWWVKALLLGVVSASLGIVKEGGRLPEAPSFTLLTDGVYDTA